MRKLSAVSSLLVLLVVVTAQSRAETPLGTAFSYQGMLTQSGQSVTGALDMSFTLWDSAGAGNPPAGGVQIGTAQAVAGVSVNKGLFTVILNGAGQFGPAAFNGNARWLQISVDGTVLGPRQAITPAPYALAVPGIDGFSLNAADGVPTDALYVDNGGRVGIGTTTPQTLLHVNGSNPALRLQNSAAAGQYGEMSAEGNSLRFRLNGSDILTYQGGSDLFTLGASPNNLVSANGSMVVKGKMGVGTTTSTDFALSVSGGAAIKGTKILLDATNVGIGTSDPLTRLHVKGTARVDILEITGGADLAEPFDVHSDQEIRAGMVVSIDPDRVGELRLADRAYDATVAGIISGAKDVHPGLVLRQEGTAADGRHPVALTGRVWCWCDADAGGAILPGNLLTTSNTAGHAMKAADPARASGATLGKAMSRLEHGKGLVLVLVNLQ